MFDHNKTAFILGAGASWHYGYPTGEELVKQVIQKAQTARDYFYTALTSPANGLVHRPNFIKRHSAKDPPADGFTGMKTEWTAAISECDDLIKRLATVDPLVIDYFLGQNPHLEDVGKLCIAWALLESEAGYRVNNWNQNRRSPPTDGPDNWYRFLIHKLATGCPDANSLLTNQVTFITFNYDVSLEYELFRGLSSLAQFDEGGVVREFFSDERFLHIYGKIRDDALAEPTRLNFGLFGGGQAQPGPPRLWTDAKALFDAVYEASKGIHIIAPHKTTAVSPVVEQARQAIAEASCIYILGYGFDYRNSWLLDLQNSLQLEKHHKTVMFTNYHDYNAVNKHASRVFFGHRDKLLAGRAAILGGETMGISVKKVSGTSMRRWPWISIHPKSISFPRHQFSDPIMTADRNHV